MFLFISIQTLGSSHGKWPGLKYYVTMGKWIFHLLFLQLLNLRIWRPLPVDKGIFFFFFGPYLRAGFKQCEFIKKCLVVVWNVPLRFSWPRGSYFLFWSLATSCMKVTGHCHILCTFLFAFVLRVVQRVIITNLHLVVGLIEHLYMNYYCWIFMLKSPRRAKIL